MTTPFALDLVTTEFMTSLFPPHLVLRTLDTGINFVSLRRWARLLQLLLLLLLRCWSD